MPGFVGERGHAVLAAAGYHYAYQIGVQVGAGKRFQLAHYEFFGKRTVHLHGSSYEGILRSLTKNEDDSETGNVVASSWRSY